MQTARTFVLNVKPGAPAPGSLTVLIGLLRALIIALEAYRVEAK